LLKKLDERPMNSQIRTLLKKLDFDKPLYLILAYHELKFLEFLNKLTEKIASLPNIIPKNYLKKF